MINWKQFDNKTISDVHGNIDLYRKLYEGKHSELFDRAKRLIRDGEIVDRILYGDAQARKTKTPYVIANIAKIIPETTATFVARSIGEITSSIPDPRTPEEIAAQDNVEETTDNLIDGSDDETTNGKIENLQEEILQQIVQNSKLNLEHWSNIVQLQVDGGLVCVPWMDENGLRLDFKARDVYFPHEDGLGHDLAYKRKINEKEYLHIFRERVEKGNLETTHYLYTRTGSALSSEPLGDEETKQLLNMESSSDLHKVYPGRSIPFAGYLANDKTFMNPLGVSILRGQESKQDEINWTLTRNAITFQRNGKPRLIVPPDVMEKLQQEALEQYGDEHAIDSENLEITTHGENGEVLQVVQIDVTKIGDVGWVKELIKLMLMETQTSEKAIDFSLSDQGTGAQSGVAKYYDLFLSILKAERIQQEYIYFLKQSIKSALWLANHNAPNDGIVIEEPIVHLRGMFPIVRKEVVDENAAAYKNGIQSLEKSVRAINPGASDKEIEEEIAKIEEGQTTDDSNSLINGRMTLMNQLDNRPADRTVIPDDGGTTT